MENEISNLQIEKKIFVIRGVHVMIDRDIAELYGVETKRLNEQVKRNILRFPEDFMLQLTQDEAEYWMSHNAISNCSRSQIATLNKSRGSNIKYLPYVFTEPLRSKGGVVRSHKLAIEFPKEIGGKIIGVLGAEPLGERGTPQQSAA